jgi:C-terminal processing protease CtpA/Prc
MRHALVLWGLLLGGHAWGQASFEEVWKKVQNARSEARKVWSAENPSAKDLQRVSADLETLKVFVVSSPQKDLVNGDGIPQIYYQRNDILVDLINTYARLKDRLKVVKAVNELLGSLIAPDSWLKGDERTMFSYYANNIAGSAFVQELMPDADISGALGELRSRDPESMLRSLPYAISDVEKISQEDRIAGLTMIWSEAKYNFANFDLVPRLDWDGEYRKFLSRVVRNQSRYEYYNTLREFIAKLNDSHTDIGLPPSLRAKMEASVLLPIRMWAGKLVVVRDPAPELQKLGLRRGDVIEKIDGVPTREYGEKRWGHLVSCSTPQDRDTRIFTYMLLRGELSKAVSLSVEHADGSRQTITVRRDMKTTPKVIPPYDFKILADGTAYLQFNTCAEDSPSEAFVKALPEIQKAGRLIIDARLNDGGNSNVGWLMVAHMVTEKTVIGSWSTRQYRPSYRAWNRLLDNFSEDMELLPRKETYTGKVAVLCSGQTFSAGEDFLAAFRASKRGLIFGMPSGGSTGQPLPISLPGGGWARICSKRDRMVGGEEFVGKGVIPDVQIETTAAHVRSNIDPVLDAALEYVNKP